MTASDAVDVDHVIRLRHRHRHRSRPGRPGTARVQQRRIGNIRIAGARHGETAGAAGWPLRRGDPAQIRPQLTDERFQLAYWVLVAFEVLCLSASNFSCLLCRLELVLFN